ncbi:MAG TPA: hypothetical protein DCL86_10070 [Bacteroidales bacterium]|jgi:hypothetical protein|nr:hypothetical protein [Bacteroidales bacterium]
MAENFTSHHFQPQPESKSEKEITFNMKQTLSPSTATIRCLLNYSKALVTVPNKLAENYSFILLN